MCAPAFGEEYRITATNVGQKIPTGEPQWRRINTLEADSFGGRGGLANANSRQRSFRQRFAMRRRGAGPARLAHRDQLRHVTGSAVVRPISSIRDTCPCTAGNERPVRFVQLMAASSSRTCPATSTVAQ